MKFLEIYLTAFLPWVAYENQHYSKVSKVNMKLQPAAG